MQRVTDRKILSSTQDTPRAVCHDMAARGTCASVPWHPPCPHGTQHTQTAGAEYTGSSAQGRSRAI